MEKENVSLYFKKGKPEDKENISQSLEKLENLGYFDDSSLKEIVNKWLKKVIKENKEDLEEVSRMIMALKDDLNKQKVILKDLEYKNKQKDFKSSEIKQKLDLTKKRIQDLEKVIEEIRNNVLQETRIN